MFITSCLIFTKLLQELSYTNIWQSSWYRCKFVLEQTSSSESSVYLEMRCQQKKSNTTESKTLKVIQNVAEEVWLLHSVPENWTFFEIDVGIFKVYFVVWWLFKRKKWRLMFIFYIIFWIIYNITSYVSVKEIILLPLVNIHLMKVNSISWNKVISF